MDTWKTVSNELEAQKKSKEWLARELGIEKMQTVNHWKGRGVPDKYHFDIEVLLKKPHGWVSGKVYEENHPIAPVVKAQAATENIAIDAALRVLSGALEQANPALRDALAGMLSSLAKTPAQPELLEALTKMLSPAAFVQDRRKAA